MMISVQPCHKTRLPSASACLFETSKLHNNERKPETTSSRRRLLVCQSNQRKVKCRSSSNGGEGDKKSERRSFLTLEEAGLVEISGLSSHERFLCRLTISSLNLLRVISEQEGCSIEELNAGRVCDWFVKDKLKREQNIESAVLQWDDSEFQI
ncbi:uncharacterized protein LOC114734408 [Neltuma alba]|uniref:uncharacterized protein LOC114734408 n=1 Tax=Neltuma alba TaxID=207710 RepID=UPI0010A3CEFE|nr:uncharacterized protein LOC114734408 [Prosopis alba]